MLSHTYKLNVLDRTKSYNVVHTAILKRFLKHNNPQDMDKDKEVICEVIEIINSRII